MPSLDKEFEDAWEQFLAVDSLRLIPDTLESEWTRGRETYLAFLVLVDETAVAAHLQDLVREIEHVPGVEPYPEAYWHITIKGIGFEAEARTQRDEIVSSEVDRLDEAAKDVFARHPAFAVRLGPANAFAEVVFAEVRDSLPVRDLNRRLLNALPNIAVYPFDGPSFLPHISVARFTSNDGITQLKQTIARRRDATRGPTFSVREIHLVRAHLSAGAPKLETIETYRLK